MFPLPGFAVRIGPREPEDVGEEALGQTVTADDLLGELLARRGEGDGAIDGDQAVGLHATNHLRHGWPRHLEALGDPYAIQAFSGQGPEAVTVAELKRFGEHLGEPVHRRIAGLEPERYTRVGAALRHATASLMRRGVRHPVLLLLSDGKPNDLDVYEGRYGVEDTRQAVLEAREQGASVLCLTVDRQAPSYIPRVFGPGSYFVLRRPELLPQALVGLMKQLVSR